MRSNLGLVGVMVFGVLVACGTGGGADDKTITLFNGKDLTGWTAVGRVKRNFWKVGTGEIDPAAKLAAQAMKFKEGGSEMVSAGILGADLRTDREFADAKIELEFMVPPVKPMANSGVFIMGEYEMQILWDPKSDPNKPGDMDQGAVVRTVAPLKLSMKEPGQWQTYEIDYIAPRFGADGKKTSNLKLVRVAVNGVVVHENVEVPGPTPGGLLEKDVAKGPLVLQGSEGPVSFRNVRITPR